MGGKIFLLWGYCRGDRRIVKQTDQDQKEGQREDGRTKAAVLFYDIEGQKDT